MRLNGLRDKGRKDFEFLKIIRWMYVEVLKILDRWVYKVNTKRV